MGRNATSAFLCVSDQIPMATIRILFDKNRCASLIFASFFLFAFILVLGLVSVEKEACTTRSAYVVVSHQTEQIGQTFWDDFRQGVEEEASMNACSVVEYVSTSYDVTKHVASISGACARSDVEALLVSVPFAKQTAEYTLVDNAIRNCTDYGTPRVVIINTDTYQNSNAVGFVGPENDIIGLRCASVILSANDHDVVAGRIPLDESSIFVVSEGIMLNPVSIPLFIASAEAANAGIRRRAESMRDTLQRWTHVTKISAQIVVGTESLLASRFATKPVVAFGIGAARQLLARNIPVSMNCGDTLAWDPERTFPTDITGISNGQIPFLQGAEALALARLSASDKFLELPRGNAALSATVVGNAVACAGPQVVACGAVLVGIAILTAIFVIADHRDQHHSSWYASENTQCYNAETAFADTFGKDCWISGGADDTTCGSTGLYPEARCCRRGSPEEHEAWGTSFNDCSFAKDVQYNQGEDVMWTGCNFRHCCVLALPCSRG